MHMPFYISRNGTQTRPSDFWIDPVLDSPSTNTDNMGRSELAFRHGKPNVAFPRIWLLSACLSTQVPHLGLGSTAGQAMPQKTAINKEEIKQVYVLSGPRFCGRHMLLSTRTSCPRQAGIWPRAHEFRQREFIGQD